MRGRTAEPKGIRLLLLGRSGRWERGGLRWAGHVCGISLSVYVGAVSVRVHTREL